VRRLLAALLPLLIAVGCSSAGTQSNGAAAGEGTTLGGDRAAGAEIYRTNCSTCHGPTGDEGGVVGPSLRHESMRMDYGATVSWIEDPEPPMPHLYPKFLTEEQVRDVAAYVNAL
jgi:mono/diheme cytochrome c family protein